AITVGLAGITGKFGRLLATHLLKNPQVTLRGYARDPSKVVPSISSSPSVRLFAGGALDDAAIKPFVSGCDVVICAYLGDNELMVDGQKQLVDACEAASVPRYIASDWSAYLETKEKVKGVHVMIGGFMETLFSPFFGALDSETNTFKYWGDGTEILESTTYGDAAQYTAKVAADPSAVGIQKFLGDRKSIKEVAASFEKVYGIKPALQRLGSQEDLKTHMDELRAKNPANIYSYMPLFYTYHMINGSTFVGPDVDNQKYPDIEPETWESFMRSRSPKELSTSMYALASVQ
ncbi:hypothetical protein B0H63DRAFT_531204, partial [Podospora didyma]